MPDPESGRTETPMDAKKDAAKFLAGIGANQMLTHGVLALTGTQFTLFGITYNQQFNTVAALFWAIILLGLSYYAWFRPIPRLSPS